LKQFVLIISCLFIVSCASFDVATPISPESGWPHKVVEVESFQPVLSWNPDFEGPADLILFEGPYTDNGYLFGGEQSKPQKMLYIEENINSTEHKVKFPLEPNRSYFWAVRDSSIEEGESEWSNYEYFAFYGIAYAAFWDQLFKFKTPGNQEN